MPDAAMGAPYTDWIKKVSHRKAPGAIKAIAFMVSPVRPRVARDGEEAVGVAVVAIVAHSLLSLSVMRACFGFTQ
jgi:hypothetical protein